MMGVGMVSLPPHDPLLILSMTAWQSWKFPCLEKWSPLPIFRYMETRKLVCNAQWPEKILSLLNNLLNFFHKSMNFAWFDKWKISIFCSCKLRSKFFLKEYTLTVYCSLSDSEWNAFSPVCTFWIIHFL